MRSVIDFERALLGIIWLSWLVYWVSAAQRTAANKRTETLLEGASYRIPLAIGVFLTVFWWKPLFLRIPALGTPSPLAAGIGLVFTVAGLCFAVWARMHLGKYWSGRITLKENHRVIQTGPYAWVRHPIYSGLILALFGTAILTIVPAQQFSGMMTPVSSLSGAAQLIGFCFPMSYFRLISVGTFTKGLGFADLGMSILMLMVFIPILTSISMLLLPKQER